MILVQINVNEGKLLLLECEVSGVKPIGNVSNIPISVVHLHLCHCADVCWFHEGEPLRVDETQSDPREKSSLQLLQPTPSKHQLLLHQVLLGRAYDEADALQCYRSK